MRTEVLWAIVWGVVVIRYGLLCGDQQQTQTLISISTVPSVSYCSTLMLFAVFNCLCFVYFTKYASH
jgi:hypothetical protein